VVVVYAYGSRIHIIVSEHSLSLGVIKISNEEHIVDVLRDYEGYRV